MEQQNETDRATNTAYVFRGGALALDLVNTEVVIRGKRQDLLKEPENLKEWKLVAESYYPELETITINPDQEFLEKVKTFRKSLRSVFSKLVEEQSPDRKELDPLNAILKKGHYALGLGNNGELSADYRAENKQDELLVTLALSVFRLLTETDPKRLHKCKNDRCILFFYDNTKSATRHWCSLGCMNRARSIQHYREQKAALSEKSMKDEG